MKSILLIILTLKGVCSFAQTMELTIDTNSKATISRHIYGHFSEHLGRCIYDGFWVNENAPVQKKDRIRLDIVEALKKIKYQTSDGRAGALPMNITGGMASDQETSARKW